jgi:hypothetical protein
MEPEVSLPSPQGLATGPFPRPCVISLQASFLEWGVVSPLPNPESGGLSLVGYQRLHIQYISSSNCLWKARMRFVPKLGSMPVFNTLRAPLTLHNQTLLCGTNNMLWNIFSTSRGLLEGRCDTCIITSLHSQLKLKRTICYRLYRYT